jgi:hypothetical protein
VHDIGVSEQCTSGIGERFGGIGCLGHHLGQGSDRDRCGEHVVEQLGHPVHGQVLMDGQVGGQRSDARSVARRSSGCAREVSLGRATTPASPTLDDVLGDDEVDLGQLEDLAVFGIDHFGVVEVRTTRGA